MRSIKAGWSLNKHVKTVLACGTKMGRIETPPRSFEIGESSTSRIRAPSSSQTQGIWDKFFPCSRSHTFTPDHNTQPEYETNIPPTPVTSFEQIPEGCVLVTYDASYDDKKKCWYLSTCVWRRDGTLFRIRVSTLAAQSDFPNWRNSTDGEIVSQASAVDYLVELVRQEEIPAHEYVNGVIFQGDNSTAAIQFDNSLRNKMSGYENLELARKLGRDDIFNQTPARNSVYLKSRTHLWDVGIKNARSVHVDRKFNRVADKSGKYVRSAEAIRKGHGLGDEGARIFATDEEIAQLSLVDGIEEHIYNFRNDKEGYEKLQKQRKEEKKRRKGLGFLASRR